MMKSNPSIRYWLRSIVLSLLLFVRLRSAHHYFMSEYVDWSSVGTTRLKRERLHAGGIDYLLGCLAAIGILRLLLAIRSWILELNDITTNNSVLAMDLSLHNGLLAFGGGSVWILIPLCWLFLTSFMAQELSLKARSISELDAVRVSVTDLQFVGIWAGARFLMVCCVLGLIHNVVFYILVRCDFTIQFHGHDILLWSTCVVAAIYCALALFDWLSIIKALVPGPSRRLFLSTGFLLMALLYFPATIFYEMFQYSYAQIAQGKIDESIMLTMATTSAVGGTVYIWCCRLQTFFSSKRK